MKILLIIVNGIGLWGAWSLSLRQWEFPGSCPTILFPACYIVAAAYLLTFISSFKLDSKAFRKIFIAGISIILAYAVAGSMMQFTGYNDCPQTGGGVPMCYISLTMAMTLLIAFIMNGRKEPAVAERI